MTNGRSTALVVLAGAIVAVGASGLAVASVGGAVLLGHVNKATGTTEISASHGAALRLASRAGAPPLVVSSKHRVPRLNASYLHGLSAKQVEAKAAAKGAIRVVATQMTGGVGIAMCPSGTTPIGGGVVPDSTGTSASDIPFIVASSPHISGGQKPVLDGWEGIASDLDKTYNGGGVVFASCSAAVSRVSAQAAAKVAKNERR
ncbi:MAG TPA: hypothetical protein VHB18_01340 [Mycobacteriales bacterium]|nr:hypothetical protein [Mycobacteriales bacterium]HVY08777.1 hypothetical protein [Mycobacteriales bacterium]